MFFVNVFGSGTSPRGRWRVDRSVTAITVMGSSYLDFTQAIFDEGETRVVVFILLGSMRIVVPRDMEVTIDGASILSSRNVGVESGLEQRTGQRLRLTVVTILGSAHIDSGDGRWNR